MHRRVAAQRAAIAAVTILVVLADLVAAATNIQPAAAPALSGELVLPDRAMAVNAARQASQDRHRQAASGRRQPREQAVRASRTILGSASHYAGTVGFGGQPVVALPSVMGGRYTGDVVGSVMVCADHCATLPVVDWCDCYWGTVDQRVADLSEAAWPLITDQPLSAGLVEVRVILE